MAVLILVPFFRYLYHSYIAMLSFPKEKINVLLLEGIHQNAVSYFQDRGYHSIEYVDHALDKKQLQKKIADAHIVGIRSRTQLKTDVLQHAAKLGAIGCFCIGTNQVDLETALHQGIVVFNAPHSNTRSVAELVLAEMIMLKRGIFTKSKHMHEGIWNKSARDSYEIRGKTLGIIGYGNIGSQLSILAENAGVQVIFYDTAAKLPLGNSRPVKSLKELLHLADIVTLHVPQTPETANMIGHAEIQAMKKGAALINASRGNVVDIASLTAALKNGHLSGAAIDVFPQEPSSNQEPFVSSLQNLDNVILTPHIGGSTLEAQANIGVEVADKLIRYFDNGTTTTAVNFPEVALPVQTNRHRILHIHKNIPGVLGKVNQYFSALQINIHAQYLQTFNDVGYVVLDVDPNTEASAAIITKLRAMPETIRSRVLF